MESLKKTKQDQQDVGTELTSRELAQMTVEAVIHRSGPLDHRQNMLDYLNNCSICGSELDFTHVTQFQINEVQMDGYCSCCDIKLKSEKHSLQ